MSSAIPTSRSRPRSTGSSPTRSTPAGCCPAPGCRPSASWAPRCASTRTRSARSTGVSPTPATSPAATAPARTSPTGRPSVAARRRSPGIVAEMLRRAAHAGFTADEVAAATFAAATERKRPGPLVRVLFAECTNADAGYDAERLVDEFPGLIEAEGAAARRPARAPRPVPLRPRGDHDVPRRGGPGAGRRAGPGRGDARRSRLRGARPRDRRAPAAARASASSAPPSAARTTSSRRCTWPGRRASTSSRRSSGDDDQLTIVDRTADLILMSREAMAAGLDRQLRDAGPDPAVGLRVRPVGPRAPAASHRARRRRPPGRGGDRRRCHGRVPSFGDGRRGGTGRERGTCPRRDFHVRRVGPRSLRRGRRPARRSRRSRGHRPRGHPAARPADERGRAPGAPAVSAGEIAALGLIHEVGHLLIVRRSSRRRSDDGHRDARRASPPARRRRPAAGSVRARVPRGRPAARAAASSGSRSCC